MSLEKISAQLQAQYPEMSQHKASEMVSAVALAMSNALIEHGSIELRGFASFRIVTNPKRNVVMPNKEIIVRPARNRVKYKASKAVIEAIN